MLDYLLIECITAGGIPGYVMGETWDTIEDMKDLALLLSPYAPGAHPKARVSAQSQD